MSAQRHGPVEEKLRKKEEEKRELCQARDKAEAVSKAEVDSLRASEEAVGSSTQQITRWAAWSTIPTLFISFLLPLSTTLFPGPPSSQFCVTLVWRW